MSCGLTEKTALLYRVSGTVRTNFRISQLKDGLCGFYTKASYHLQNQKWPLTLHRWVFLLLHLFAKKFVFPSSGVGLNIWLQNSSKMLFVYFKTNGFGGPLILRHKDLLPYCWWFKKSGQKSIECSSLSHWIVTIGFTVLYPPEN